MKEKVIFFLLGTIQIVCAEIEPIEQKECPFSGITAEGTEWMLAQGETHPALKHYTSFGARAISVIAFPISTMADILYHSFHALSEKGKIASAQDEQSRQYHEQLWLKNKENLKRSWLGFIYSPVGALYPDLVTQHFVPEKFEKDRLIPYGKLYSINAYEIYPKSEEDVQNILIEAHKKGKKVSVLGSGMSQGKQALPSENWNLVINTSRLNKIQIDPTQQIATVQAGATWADLQREANQHGLAVRVMQASNIFSIGGSLSANCHGWDHKSGNLRNTILEITLVDPTGQILHLTDRDELFNYVLGGYGGFGVITEAKISLTENAQLLEVGETVSPQDYVTYFEDNIRDDEMIDMHLYRLSLDPKNLFGTGIAVNYLNQGNACAAELIDEPERGHRKDRIKLHTIRRLKWLRKIAWEMEKKGALREKVASRNEIMRPPINPIFNNSQIDCEWLQEYFVKGENLNDFVSFLAKTLKNNQVALFNASVRFVKQDPDTKLSYTKNGDRFAIVLFFNQKLTPCEIQKTEKWVREVIDYLVAHEGTYYLPYQHFATLEQFRSCYPDWQLVAEKKQILDPNTLFQNGLYADYLSKPETHPSYFRTVFGRQDLRPAIRSFLTEIFMQFDEEKLFALVDNILENPHLTDEEIYRQLVQKIDLAKPSQLSLIARTYSSLRSIKEDLSSQVNTIVGDTSIKGYVEIGYTGRLINPLKKKLSLQGPIYVINEQEKLADYLEIGGLRNYNLFINLNNYDPIPEDKIPSQSVDLVSCYIGLHHIPPEKIGPFIQSIHRVLRPGGKFILMDHDAFTPDLQILADVAHSLFNAGTGIPPDENQSELRNFQSLKTWIQIVENHGFKHNLQSPLIRAGDSTLNSLICFNKPTDLRHQIEASLNSLSNYTRPSTQTYMTAPEWQNVRAAQRYAKFVEKYPAYRFPYFEEIGGYWKVLFQSFKAARKEHSFSEVFLSEYMYMDLFVGTMMTLEYGLKGALSLPFKLLPNFEKNSPPELERVRSLKAYSTFIEEIPFYQYPYFKDIKLYWQSLYQSFTFKDLLTGIPITIENTLKGTLSLPFRWIYGSGPLQEAKKIGLLIQYPNDITNLDPRITLIESYANDLKYIELPRYIPFKEVLFTLSEQPNLQILNIAGNDKIQVDTYRLTSPPLGCHELYQIPADQDIVAYDVEVSKLLPLLQKENDKIIFIHDY